MSRLKLIRVLVVVALSAPLGGCGGGMFGGGFDPTDIFNFLDSKKPLPGDRKPVFPEGVPGVDRGVPPEMVRGSPGALATRQQIEQAQQPQFQQPQQPGATQAAVTPAEEEAPPAAAPRPSSPRPKAATTKRRSVTAPPPAEEAPPPQAQRQQPPQQAQPSPFPSPMQSGTFQRQ